MARTLLAASLAASLICATGAALAATAADEPAIGTAFSGFMDLAGKQVPLPEGTWTLVGRSFEKVPELDGDAYGAVESVVLFRIEDATVTAFIIADRNLIPIEEGWGTASECIGEKDDVPLVVNYDASMAHAFCGFAGATTTGIGEESPGSWTDAVDYAQQSSLALPFRWLMVGFRLSDTHDVLDVRYHFIAPPAEDDERGDAAASGTLQASADQPQHAWVWSDMLPAWLAGGAGAEDDEAKLDTPSMRGLADWLGRMRMPVQLGFSNGLAACPPVAMPWTTAASEPDPATTIRLRKLEQLQLAGALDPDQAQMLRRLIEEQKPHLAEAQISSASLTLIKAGADQVTAAVPTFIGNFLVLGSLPQAATLLGLQTAVDFVHDYSIELAWNVWGPQRLREEPTIDFPEPAERAPTSLHVAEAPAGGPAFVRQSQREDRPRTLAQSQTVPVTPK